MRWSPTAPWRATGVAEPITDVHVMAGLRNRYRPLVVDGAPVALGFLTVGDASVCTNPLYGRGCSLALVHAFGLADALREHGDDHESLARVFAGVHRARAGALVPHGGVPGRAGTHASRGRRAAARGSARVRAEHLPRRPAARAADLTDRVPRVPAVVQPLEHARRADERPRDRERGARGLPEPRVASRARAVGPARSRRARSSQRRFSRRAGRRGRGRCRRPAGGSRSRASARTRRACRSPRGATPARRGTRSTRRRRTRRPPHRSRT